MHTDTPLVSIVIPVYNRIHLIDQTLASAFAQTYPNIEVVVVDNASTDGTWDRLIELARHEPRLRIFQNASNIGPVRNWLACVAQARGELCKILWSDDLISADFLAATVPCLADPGTGFAYTSVQIFEGTLTEGGPVSYLGPGEGVHSSERFIRGILLAQDYPFSPGCALFRTDDVRANLREQVPNRLGSDFSMHAIGNDLLLFLLTAKHYPRFAVIGRPLSQFRSHAGSISTESAGARIWLHYDIAKAAFVEMSELPKSLVDRFNALLQIDLKRYDGRPFGLNRVADFYSQGEVRPSLRALLTEAGLRLCRKVTRLGTRPAG